MKTQRHRIVVTDRGHSWQLLQAVMQAAAENIGLLRVIAGGGKIKLRQRYSVWRKSRIDRACTRKTLYEQYRADQCHGCESHFGDHHRATQTVSLSAGTPGASALLQRIIDIGSRRAQSWRQSRENRNENGQCRRETKNLTVHGRSDHHRSSNGGQQPAKGATEKTREEHATDRTGECHQQRF